MACTAGFGAAGAIALVGDLPATIDAFWDKHSMGKQAEKKSLLENEAVDKSSKLILGTSIVATLGLTVLQL